MPDSIAIPCSVKKNHQSTKDQDLSLQYEALKQINCDKIYDDKINGIPSKDVARDLGVSVLILF